MKITDAVEIIDSYPAAYIKPLDAIVIADLHLGYETIAAENGVFLPKIQYSKTIEKMRKIISKIDAKNIIINGDIKHEFSETSYHEYKEVKNFFDFLNNLGFEKIIVLKGNHDNFIINITRKYDNIELHNELAINDFLFLHGHKDKNIIEIKQKNIILAHEHPAIGLYTEIGVK
ncbi:MAG: metallophosphoesterase, partial [Thermoplasmata archaeon]|nr:metallophosphoesterase [Thermoplasmata archaeon]